jgi:hypothetical protein
MPGSVVKFSSATALSETSSGSGAIAPPASTLTELALERCLTTSSEAAAAEALESGDGLLDEGTDTAPCAVTEHRVLRLEMLLFPSIADVAVLSVDMNNKVVRIEARGTTAGSASPDCGSWSSRAHSSYLRFPADVPTAGRRVGGIARPEDLFRGQWQYNRTSALDVFKPYLDERWDEGCTNAWKLWGGRSSRLAIRAATALSAPTSGRRAEGVRIGNKGDRIQLKAALANCPELTALAEHVRSFAHMLTHAVTAGLTLPWNSGVVEGHVNRIKMLKRQMFGRAGFELLRKRVLLA